MTGTPEQGADLPAVADVRPWLPARDFARSLAFYTAVGWEQVWADDGLALLELGGARAMLQDFYVREWAETSMLTVEVADARAWPERIAAILAVDDFGGARGAEPAHEDWGATVTYVWDPSGVLLHFAQFDA